MKRVVWLAALVVAGCAHSPDRYIEPYGKDTYRVDDGEGLHYANRFCAAKGAVMQPLAQGTAWADRDVLVFKCVSPAAAQTPNVRLEDGHVTLNDEPNSTATP
jgi:hypothetical protein